MAFVHRAHGTVGRRNRRLRAFLKHERMTVAFGDYSAPLIHEVRRGGCWCAGGVALGSSYQHMSSAPVTLAPHLHGLVDPQFSLTVDETSHVAPAVSLSVPSQQLPFVTPRQQLLLTIWKSFLSPCTTKSTGHIAASEMPLRTP